MKPLIIAFFDGDPEVKILSNFATTPFTLDDKKYFTVEAFWQQLKSEDEAFRVKIRALESGFDAKQIAQTRQHLSSLFTYEGQMYVAGSKEHHILLERAMRAKTAQNKKVETALLASGNAPLKHMLKNSRGVWKPGDSPRLPASVFEDIWTRIRAEIQDEAFIADMPLPPGIVDEAAWLLNK